MIYFSCNTVADITYRLPDKIGTNCSEYILTNNERVIGKVLTSDKFALLNYENQTLIIKRVKFYFKQKKYSIDCCKTGQTFGKLEFLDSYECIVSLNKGSTYFFHENRANKKLLNPTTWFNFEHHLTDSVDDICYSGNKPLNGLSKGIIETTNEQLLLPTLVGLFILDEFMRTFQENSG